MAATVTIHKVGREERPLAVIDDFAADPGALRAAAEATGFGPAAHHYPGLRAPLPSGYMAAQQPLLAEVAARLLGRSVGLDPIDASFSMVTTPPGNLSVRQRLPHCDAFAPGRIALVHFLSPEESGGTAFYRHRSTGFETVDDERAPIFFGQLDAELRLGGLPPPRYCDEHDRLFEQTMLVAARYNRALVYQSYVLHSGAIPRDATLSTNPASGRLTVTAFLSATSLDEPR